MQEIFEPFASLPLARSFQRHSHSNTPRISSHAFRVRPLSINKRYAELEIFRQHLEQSKAGIHHQPYTDCKKDILIYKSIFFAFSGFFVCLGLATFHLQSYISLNPYFSSTLIKSVVTLLCFLFSFSSSTFALFLRTEQEAVYRAIRKTKRSLAATYSRKQLKLGFNGFFVFGSQRRQYQILKQMYQETLEKVSDKKEEILHLIQRISSAQGLNKQEKEILFNQAIEELIDKLMLLTRSFKHSFSQS